jgi:hypothetical protein
VSQYELEGSIKIIFDTQTFDSGFTKREFVVTTDEKYPQDVKFECVKDKCALLDSYNLNDRIKVHFNIRGNEYKERFYVNLQAWKLEDADSAGSGVGATEDVTMGDVDMDPFAGEESPF